MGGSFSSGVSVGLAGGVCVGDTVTSVEGRRVGPADGDVATAAVGDGDELMAIDADDVVTEGLGWLLVLALGDTCD